MDLRALLTKKGKLGADAELPTRYRSPVNLRDEISEDGMELSWRNSGGRGIRGRFRYRVAELPHIDSKSGFGTMPNETSQ